MNLINWYTETAWHKWWMEKVWRPSWTKLTSFVVGFPATLLMVGQAISAFSNDSTVQSYLAQMHVPSWFPSTLAGLSLVFYVASGRK